MKQFNQALVYNIQFNQLKIWEERKIENLTCTPFKSQSTDTAREQLYLRLPLDILTMIPMWGFFLSAIRITLKPYIYSG
jgi:hypothetical protein